MEIKERKVEYFYTSKGKAPVKEWLNSIKDKMTLAIVYKRIRQAALGNFGDSKAVGLGVMELRVNYGPGFRIYYAIHNNEIILLLLGGTKKSQTTDIIKAKGFWQDWKEQKNEN